MQAVLQRISQASVSVADQSIAMTDHNSPPASSSTALCKNAAISSLPGSCT